MNKIGLPNLYKTWDICNYLVQDNFYLTVSDIFFFPTNTFWLEILVYYTEVLL